MLLDHVTYDPAAVGSVSAANLLAMTALDTTNARLQFTAPGNGFVWVRIRSCIEGATADPQILLGLREHTGGVVVARQVPVLPGSVPGATAASERFAEVAFPLAGLSGAKDWDLAYGVETLIAASVLQWGGPNSAAAAGDASGPLIGEVWEAANMLAGLMYDPGGAAVSKSLTALLAMTALDTTNLRATFTTPASGPGSTKVFVNMRCAYHMTTSTTGASVFLGVLGNLAGGTGTNVLGRVMASQIRTSVGAAAVTDRYVCEGSFVVDGLTPSTSYSFDAAYGVEKAGSAGAAIRYGGPDDTTADNAWGGFAFSVWAA